MMPHIPNQANRLRELGHQAWRTVGNRVNNGIAVRMAVMALAMAGQRQAGDFKAYN